MRLASESAAVLMPAGSRQVLSAPTHTCTSLHDHVLLTSAKPEILINHVDITWTVYFAYNLDCCSNHYHIILLVCLSKDNRVCLAESRVIVLFVLQLFWLFLPLKKSLLKVGNCTWMYSTAPRRRRARLSVLLGSQPVIWGEIRAVWDFKRCGREWVELPVSAVWSFDSYVSKQSRYIRLRSVWCWKVWKKKCQKRCILEYFTYSNSHLGRLRWTLITLLGYSLCQNWLSWRIAWIIACCLEYFNIFFGAK